MSIKVMAQVWESNLPSEQKYVLLKMADHADDEGYRVFPSVKLVAHLTGVSERTVQRRLRELTEMGVLEVMREASHHHPTEYRIRGDKLTPLPRIRGDNGAVRGDTGDTLTIIETSTTQRDIDNQIPSRKSSNETSVNTKPRARGEAVLCDPEFMAELHNRFPGRDYAYEGEKWLDHIASKPPKGNYKNSLRNWMERSPAMVDVDREWLAERYKRGKDIG